MSTANSQAMKFGSVCSGIEAASVAWRGLGWSAAWLSEIEPFPSAVLAHHYPEVPNLGDMTTLPKRIVSGEVDAPEVFCGGTPCQAFSVAGSRKSLDDARGNLSLTFCEIANAIDTVRFRRGESPAIVFWENVPGVLSTKDNAFGCFLAGLAGEDDALIAPGGKWSHAGAVYGPKRAVAWRTLDAQYFGLAQRRRRVFVVASARDGFDPAAVLFEFEGVRRDTAPSRGEGKVAPTTPARSTGGGGLGTDFDLDGGVIAHTLKAKGFNAGEGSIGLGAPTLPVAFPSNLSGTQHASAEDLSPALGAKNPTAVSYGVRTANTSANGHGINLECAHTLDQAQGQCVAYAAQAGALRVNPARDLALEPNVVALDTTQITSAANFSNPKPGDPCHPLAAGAHPPAIAFPSKPSGPQYASANVSTAMLVRRLTPVECERLQGFPDNYTSIPWRKKPASECPDGPRYKALGNSWAVPVVRWIGRRIAVACYEGQK